MSTLGQSVRMPPTKFKAATGLTEAELQVVIAVLSCEHCTGGYPTREAILQVATLGKGNLVYVLANSGWLVNMGRTPEMKAFCAVSEMAKAKLGFSDWSYLREPERAEVAA